MADPRERLWPTVAHARPLEEDPDKVRLVIELPRPLDNFEYAAFTKWRADPGAKGPKFEIKKGHRKFFVVVNMSALVDEVGQIRDFLDHFEDAGKKLRDAYDGAKNQLDWTELPALRKIRFMKPE